jgi:hypothetical protein
MRFVEQDNPPSLDRSLPSFGAAGLLQCGRGN